MVHQQVFSIIESDTSSSTITCRCRSSITILTISYHPPPHPQHRGEGIMLLEYATVLQASISHIAHQQCLRCTTQNDASPCKMMEACKHTQLQNRQHIQILFDAIVAVITASIINRQKYNLNSNLHSAYRITLVYTSLLSRNDEKRSNGSHFKGKH